MMVETPQNSFNLVVVAVIALVAIVSIAALVLSSGSPAATPASQFVQPNIESADLVPLSGDANVMFVQDPDGDDSGGSAGNTQCHYVIAYRSGRPVMICI